MSSPNSNNDFFIDLEWNEATEELLISWADIATCYTWLFENAYRTFTKKNYRFSIPIIIFSTITGAMSLSLGNIFPEEYIHTAQIAIGAVNIINGIASTLQNFFRYAQLSELHLTATNDWAKLQRNIKIELSIERQFRRPATEFVRSTRQEYDRLLNSRPIVPIQSINEFKSKFNNSKIIKPDILEDLEHTYLDDNKNIIVNKFNIDKKPKFLDRLKHSIAYISKGNSPHIQTNISPIKKSTDNIDLNRTPTSQKSLEIQILESSPKKIKKSFYEVKSQEPFLKNINNEIQINNQNLSNILNRYENPSPPSNNSLEDEFIDNPSINQSNEDNKALEVIFHENEEANNNV